MGYPNGVSLAVISGGTAFTAFGDDVPVQITVTPRFPKQGGGFLTRIIHAATGWVMTSDPDTFTAEAGTEVSFSVPHVDQAGFRDPAQNAYTGWYYEVKVVVGAARGRTKTAYTQTVSPVVGQALVDLDLVPEGQTGDPQSVVVPEVISVAGFTGAVTEEDLRSLGLGGASDPEIATLVQDETTATGSALVQTFAPASGSSVYAGKSATGYTGSPEIVQDPVLAPAEVDKRSLAVPERAPGVEKPVGDSSRRNIWQYTEEVGSSRYSSNTTHLAKSTDTIVRDGVTMTRLTSRNFYAALYSQMPSLGIAPLITGKRYLLSYFILARTEGDRFFWMRDLGLNATHGHGQRLLEPNRVRRVWTIQQATAPDRLRGVTVAANGYDTGVSGNPTWYMQGNQGSMSSTFDIYVGGFQIEQIADTAVDGIAGIGDSTMQGASGATDAPAAREWMGYLAGLLNVNTYNRGVGGQRTDAMDARWATDITPLKGVSKYVIIQGGINDIAQDRPLADIQASISSMHGKAVTDGFIPVMLTCTPTASIGNTAAREASRVALNAWLKQTFPNVIDIAAVVEDPLDPRFIRRTPGGSDGWYGDGVHYTQAAKRAVAEKIAAWPGWSFPTPSPYQKVVGEAFTPQGGVVLVAPDGSRHRLTVDNTGALTTTPA